MSRRDARSAILARRAQFLAAALAGAGCGPAPHVEPVTAVAAAPEPPDDDRDHDGKRNAEDVCPDAPEDKDGFEDDDGCPDPDNDKDGVPDVDDKCPNVAALPPSTDGCPKPTVCLSIVQGPIQIYERIYFAEDKSTILPQSMQVLDAVVAVLAAHPEIRLEVQGHCNAIESPKVSGARAKAVIAYLVAHGIDTKRLAPKDMGKTAPADSNATAVGRERNRRVEFVRTDL
ncbi:MAG: OmpA family protein [Polyangiales bacterium]